MSQSAAGSIKGYIEKLVVARASNQGVELHTASWLAGIGNQGLEYSKRSCSTCGWSQTH